MTVHNRSSKDGSIRHARMNAADRERALPVATPIVGGWARTRFAKSLLFHLTTDQAADIIAGLSESDTPAADRKQLDDAGIEFTDSTEPPATPALASPALPVGSTAPVEAVLSVPAGAPASTVTGRPDASEGSSSGVSPRADPVEPTPSESAVPPAAPAGPVAESQAATPADPSTAAKCVGPLGSYARHRYDNLGACRRCNAPDPRATAKQRILRQGGNGMSLGEQLRAEEAAKNDHPLAVSELSPGVGDHNEAEAPAPPATVTTTASGVDAGGPTISTLAAESTTTPPPRTAVSPAPFSKAQADDLPAIAGAGAPSVSGPGATSIDRRRYIGSADAPAILGLSPHSTPWDVFAKKVGAVEDKGGDWLEMGLDLEPIIAKWAARQLEAHNMRKGETLLHPDETWAGATVDYFATVPGSTVVIVECKALGSFSPWKDDEVPLHIVAQVHWQCGIARAAGVWADRLFVARMKGLEVKVFEVRYEPALFDAMLAKCRAFWAQVQSKTPPPIDGSSSAKAWIESVYPAARKALRTATEAEVFTITQYVVARDQAGAAKKRQDAAANEIRALIGDAEGVIGGGVVAKWTGKEGAARRLDVRAVTGKGDE